MINSDAKSKIEKCIACNSKDYSYALSLHADCVPDSIKKDYLSSKKIRKF